MLENSYCGLTGMDSFSIWEPKYPVGRQGSFRRDPACRARTQLPFDVVQPPDLLGESLLESGGVGVELWHGTVSNMLYLGLTRSLPPGLPRNMGRYSHLGIEPRQLLPKRSQPPDRFHWQCRAGSGTCPPNGKGYLWVAP